MLNVADNRGTAAEEARAGKKKRKRQSTMFEFLWNKGGRLRKKKYMYDRKKLEKKKSLGKNIEKKYIYSDMYVAAPGGVCHFLSSSCDRDAVLF